LNIARIKSIRKETKIKNLLPAIRLFSNLQANSRVWLFFPVLVVELLASAISGVGFVLNNRFFLISGTIIWAGWFALIFIIAAPRLNSTLDKYKIHLKRLALSIFMLLFILGVAEVIALVSFHSVFTQSANSSGLGQAVRALEHGFHYNDATALAHQATENFIQGKNPYTKPNIVIALLDHDSSYDRVTPLRTGRFANQFPYPDNNQLAEVWSEAVQNPQQPPIELETKLNYPAGSFLIPAPFFLAGLKDIRIVYIIVVLAGCIYAVWLLPRDRRILFLGAAIASLEIWNSIATGETGTLVFPFLLLAWLLVKKHPWQSTIFMGVAITTKQTSWFFLPFYLIYMFRVTGIKKLIPLIGTTLAIFVAANLPFMINDPKLWFDSLMAPMTESIFPVGVGIITLVTAGLLYIQSPMVFTALEFIAIIICIVWYYRYGRRYPNTGPILSVIPLFFAWRSLWTYFFYMGLIVFALILANEKILKPDLHARNGDSELKAI
jgi:hypothetical protein